MKLPELKRNKGLEQACGFSAHHYVDAVEYGKACYRQAVIDAMNATRAYGKTGEAMALTIQQLAKEPT